MTSRVARKPILLPKGVQVNLSAEELTVTGPKGTLKRGLSSAMQVTLEDNVLLFTANDAVANANVLTGTERALAYNMIHGVSAGYEKKLTLIGVGYRAQLKGKFLGLTLGFSHPIDFPIPAGITIETPSQTEIIVKGIDKQLVGETAAKIRNYRPPEPYKGKGVRYADEVVQKKETKKK